MSRNCYSNDQITEHQLQTNDLIDLDSAQSIAYSTYSMMASNDFLARKLNYKQTKRRIMVYWKLNRRYQVGTDIWEPRTSVKHFSSLSWCISWPQAENTISNSTLKWHLLRTALRRGHPPLLTSSYSLQYNDKYCKQLQSTALDSSGAVVLQKKILFCKISKI